MKVHASANYRRLDMFISKNHSNTSIVGLLVFSLSVVTALWAHGQNEINRSAAGGDAKEKLAAERFEKILLAKPQYGTAFDRFYEFHRGQGTLDALSQRLRENADAKKDANAYQLLGLVEAQRGEHTKAVELFRKATELAATDVNAWINLARALIAVQKFDESLAALKNASEQKPPQSVVLEMVKLLSQIVERAADRELASLIVSELAGQYPTNVPINEQLAEIFVDLGRAESALPLFDALIAQTRDAQKKLELRMKRAQLYEQLGQAEKSLSELEAMLPLVRPQSWLHSKLVEETDRLANELYGLEGLVKYYEQRLEKDASNVVLMLRLANVLQELQKDDEAEKWIRKACTAAPGSVMPWLALAEWQERSGNFAEALKSYDRAIQLGPENADVILRAAQCALQDDAPESERKANAATIWRRLLKGKEKNPST